MLNATNGDRFARRCVGSLECVAWLALGRTLLECWWADMSKAPGRPGHGSSARHWITPRLAGDSRRTSAMCWCISSSGVSPSPARCQTELMRRIPLVLLLLAGSLSVPSESQQGFGVLSETREPAPIRAGRAPRPGEYAAGFDALHYGIRLTLPATGSVIDGTTEIQLALAAGAPDILRLDLTGLQVTGVRVDGTASRFVHDEGRLLVPLPRPGPPGGSRIRVAVDYRGTPDDGLIIRNNVHGHRAAFADNW